MNGYRIRLGTIDITVPPSHTPLAHRRWIEVEPGIAVDEDRYREALMITPAEFSEMERERDRAAKRGEP